VAQTFNALGEYLRARREQLRPEDVGLVSGARRRVPGLRREELATLAGISSAYYLRLEQGRDTHPSAQVIDALARALYLDALATGYLHRLASAAGASEPHAADERADEGLLQLIDQLVQPAVIVGKYQDVLAANPCARALAPGFRPGQNFLSWRFLDPAAREFYVDWDTSTEVGVSVLREVAATRMDDPRMRALIDELLAASQRFRDLWGRADVVEPVNVMHLRHPKVGDLHLILSPLAVPHSNIQHLLIYHAEPGSPSARALATLHSMATN
jgi:transcriptional regulator with XRE-family HTH domain